jgi:hypothetical protein
MSVDGLLAGVPLPAMLRVEQRFARPRLHDVEDELRHRIRGALAPGALRGRSVAVGVGSRLADFTTGRAYRKLRFEQTYPNALTTTVPTTVKIPMVLANDRLAIQAAIKTSGAPDKSRVRLVRIRNTKTLDVVQVSAALGDDVDLDARVRREGAPFAMAFDEHGDLL